MAGIEIPNRLETKLRTVVSTLGGDWSYHQTEVIARVDSINDLGCKPPRAFGEYGSAAVRPGLPQAVGEFVDVVARLLAE